LSVRHFIAVIRRLIARQVSKPARVRYRLARAYLIGFGVEVGALHNPLPTGQEARVKYVDRLSRRDLLKQYPELPFEAIVPPDIIDDGEQLASIRCGALDFIVANHFIEHCQDPISTIMSFFSKLKAGGIVFLAVPDKRFTFDRLRESTTIAHLQFDHQDGGRRSREQHYMEFAQHALPEDVRHGTDTSVLAKQLIVKNYSIHFHVWTYDEFFDFLRWIQRHHLQQVEILEAIRNGREGLFILRKATAPSLSKNAFDLATPAD
jgi:SAM-dependent methyltransferase